MPFGPGRGGHGGFGRGPRGFGGGFRHGPPPRGCLGGCLPGCCTILVALAAVVTGIVLALCAIF